MTGARFLRGGFRAAVVAVALAAGLASASARGLPAFAVDDLPPPPTAGTPADAADRLALATQFSAERIAAANRDTVLDPFLAFDPVLGIAFERDALPETQRLLGAVQAAVGRAILAAKRVFPRTRPYGEDEGLARCGIAFLRVDRSYPSGHAATGQAWAIVLAWLLPSRRDALLARGLDYGTSRVVCGVHWPSDVAAGQAIGAAVAASILDDPGFARLVVRATAELAPFG